MANLSSNKQYSSDEEFDDYEDYDAHLGKCRKHINNVAVAKGATKPTPTKNKINQLPKKKKETNTERNYTERNNKERNVTERKTLTPPPPQRPVTAAREVVDDWEDLM